MDLCCTPNHVATPEDFKRTLIRITTDLKRENKLLDETLCILIRWYLEQNANKVISREPISDVNLKQLQDKLIDLSMIDIAYGCTYRKLYFLTYGKYPIEEEVKDEQS